MEVPTIDLFPGAIRRLDVMAAVCFEIDLRLALLHHSVRSSRFYNTEIERSGYNVNRIPMAYFVFALGPEVFT